MFLVSLLLHRVFFRETAKKFIYFLMPPMIKCLFISSGTVARVCHIPPPPRLPPHSPPSLPQDRLRVFATSLLLHASLPLRLHVVSDDAGFAAARRVIAAISHSTELQVGGTDVRGVSGGPSIGPP